MTRPISFDKCAAGIPPSTLRSLYQTMLRIRRVEVRIGERYKEDEMHTPIHLCIGQEAISAGVCAHLRRDDYLFSNHRGHGHYLAKGGGLKEMIAELYNRETGCSRGRGGSMHLIDTSVSIPGTSSIVAGSVPIGTGAALAAVMQKTDKVSVVFLGDAATEEGVVQESIAFAMLKKLPVIYVCENNSYAVCSPLSNRQATNDIYRRFEGLSVSGHLVDGNNVTEVYCVAKEAIEKARSGGGPSFMECRTYRMTDHHGGTSGVEVGYRTQAEVDEWAGKCPVSNFERFLVERSILSAGDIAEYKSVIDREVAEAFEFARSSPLPDANDVGKYLYA